jgi:hypothetical protein
LPSPKLLALLLSNSEKEDGLPLTCCCRGLEEAVKGIPLFIREEDEVEARGTGDSCPP